VIENVAKIVNEAVKDKMQENLIDNNHRAGGNASLIAQQIADRFHLQGQQGSF
jgi:hypothetical protein